MPGGLGNQYRWVDLYGEGLPGILAEGHHAWYFKSNIGDGHFAAQQVVLERPTYRLGHWALTDFDGDGDANLVALHGRQAGFYEYDRDAGNWRGYQPISAIPHVEGAAPNAQWADLNGDGRADLIVADPQRLTWYPSEGKTGFGAPVEIARPAEAPVAALLGESLALNFFFADMNGDGVVDQVRVCNGRVEYWPHAGHGRFGEPILMDGSPMFAPDGEFDARRVFLVDLDSSGTADIVYVGQGEVRYWINASGNELVEGSRLSGLPYIDNVSTVRIFDFLGNGMPCLVWSSPLTDRGGAIQYLPLTDGIVPRLLVSVDNSMGREVQFEYGYSARHYLRDSAAGISWRTKLPSHRTVVDSKHEIDQITGARTTVRFEYHDGCYDGDERVFRGFGMVEQFDTEVHGEAGTAPEDTYTTPACVRTWYHVGLAPLGVPHRCWTSDPQHTFLSSQIIEGIDNLLPGEAEDAARALAGVVLRQEVFAVTADGSLADHPFQVNQSSYRLRRLQPSGGGGAVRNPPCFMYYRGEQLDEQFEQASDDPRTVHVLALDVDAFGTVRQECRVAYARRAGQPVDAQAQQRVLMTASRGEVLNIDQPERYEIGIAVDRREFEIAGLPLLPASLFSWDAFHAAVPPLLATPLRFDETLTGVTPEARLIGWERYLYWNDAQTAPLASATISAVTLLHHSESACFTPELIAGAYGGRVDTSLLSGDGGYHSLGGYWWQTDSTLRYHDADGFFQLASLERADGAMTRLAYDADTLALVELEDAFGNRVSARIDHHVMAPDRLSDPNGTVTEVMYDPLGVPIVSTMHGHVLDAAGTVQPYGQDLLAVYNAQDDAKFNEIVANPASFVQSAAEFLYYDLDAWSQNAIPARSVRLVREDLRYDGTGAGVAISPVQVTVSYFDGFQRVLQAKGKVEGGPAVQRDALGQLMLDGQGNPVSVSAAERWLVTGHTLYNRKQQPVRQYEPFHSTVVAYEPEPELAEFGVFHQFRYDAVGRMVDEEFPNGTYTHVEYGTWSVARYDQNDTVQDSLYRVLRENLPDGDHEKVALTKAQAHANTPTLSYFDPLGREIKRVVVSGEGGDRVTEIRLDVSGNPITVTDARGLTAFSYTMDMLDRVCTSASADAGQVWSLHDGHGREIHAWNARGVHERRTFDLLDRPTGLSVDGALGLNHIVERIVYGEDASITDAVSRNLRGRAAVHFDQAGVVRTEQHSPGGELLRAERQLLHDYKAEPNWSDPAGVVLDPERYVTENGFDGLGQLRRQSLPDGTTRILEYLRGGPLARCVLTSADGKVAQLAVLQDVTVNARSQRLRVLLGNGVEIGHEFDGETFRTKRILATRTSDGHALHDLRYIYDPVGNIVHAVDEIQQPAFPGPFLQGLNVSPAADYTYDAFYQLRRATGRVHQALLEHDYRPHVGQPGAMKGTRHLTFNNGSAIERYTRTYVYDADGNLQKLSHLGTSQSWTTDFWISATSNRSVPALDPSGSPVVSPEARFDAAGNLSMLPHLRAVEWTYRNTLAKAVIVDRASTGQADDAEYYQYDGAGLRVRKVTERLVAGAIEATETLYLDGCTIKRVRLGGNLILERLTSHISDGTNRIALMDRWNHDNLARETDDVAVARVRYQLSNHLGSAQLELDELGAVVSYEEYFPFGNTAFIAGDDAREVTRREFRFCGKERDDATGLDYVEHRYYASWLARWLSPDPIGPEDDLNLYVYCRNNTINLIDPDGLAPKTKQWPSVARVPAEVKNSPFADMYKGLSAQQKAQYREGTHGFYYDYETGQKRFGPAAVVEAQAELWIRETGMPQTIGITGAGPPRPDPGVAAEVLEGGARVNFEADPLVAHPTEDVLLGDEDAVGRSASAPPPAPGQPEGAPGSSGGHVEGADGNDADGTGTSESASSDSASAHPADGSSAPTPRSAGFGGGAGPGARDRGAGPGASGALGTSNSDGSDANGGRGPGRGPSRGPAAGTRRRGDSYGGTGAPGVAKRGVPGAEPGVGGGTRKEGPSGGTGQEPGGAGTDPGGTGLGDAGTGPGIGNIGGTIPADGEPPAVPAQTLNGDDPFGADSVNPPAPGGTGTGTGSASPTGDTPVAEPGPRPERSIGDQITHYLGYANLEFGDGDPNGVATGGIPGAFGKYHAGGWGQALYGVLTVATVVLTILSFGASKAALTGGMAGLRAALRGGIRALRGAARSIGPRLAGFASDLGRLFSPGWLGRAGSNLMRFVYAPATKTFTSGRQFWNRWRGLFGRNSGRWGWTLEHSWIKQRWYRGSNPLFPPGSRWSTVLQRLGDAGWNLYPMPRWLNSKMYHFPVTSTLLNTGVYGASVYAPVKAWSLAAEQFRQLQQQLETMEQPASAGP